MELKKEKWKRGMEWNGKWKKGGNKMKMMFRTKKKRRDDVIEDYEYMNVYDNENLDDQKIEAEKDKNFDR